MTTQVLMSSSVLLSNATAANDLHDDQIPVKTAQTASPAAVTAEPRKLPYQVNHQVELMHLQAETEALLQRLQTLKQQRLSEFDADGEPLNSESSGSTAADLVVSR